MEKTSATTATLFGKNIKVNDGEVTIKYVISNGCNFGESDNLEHYHTEKLEDLIPFLVGLTIIPTGVDGSSDDEVNIFIESGDPTKTGWRLIKMDKHFPGIQKGYVLWTDDGDYEDDELTAIQSRMTRVPCKLTLLDIGCVVLGEKRLGMRLDMFDTLFVEDIHPAFIRGLKCFEDVAKSDDVRIIDLNGPEPEDSDGEEDNDEEENVD